MRDINKLGPSLPAKTRKTLDALPIEKIKDIERKLVKKAMTNFDSMIALSLIWNYLYERDPSSVMTPDMHHARMGMILNSRKAS